MEDKFNDFKLFTKWTRHGNKPFFSLSKGGSIIFSRAFSTDHEIEKYKFVLIGFSQNNKAIAIKFESDVKIDAKKLTKCKYRWGFQFSASIVGLVKKHPVIKNYLGNRYNPKLETIPNFGECFVIYLEEKL